MTTVREAAAAKAAANLPAEVGPREAIRQEVERNKAAIGASLPSGMSQERFARLLLTAANTNPDLFDCEPRSFLAAGVLSAQLGLEPNDPRGLAYLIPRTVKGRKVATFLIGYRGLMDLARRSGQVSAINAFPVFEGDEFSYELGLDPKLHHVPNEDGDEDPARLTHVYAVAKVNGEPQFVVLRRKQIDKIRDASGASRGSFSPWVTHYVEMAKKTAIRALCKYLPQSVELATALDQEERTLTLGDLGGISTIADNAEPGEFIEARLEEAAS